MRVLVTGANGFVGSLLCKRLAEAGIQVRAAVRDLSRSESMPPYSSAFEVCSVGNIDELTDWKDALKGIDIVIHTAARVHVMRDRSGDPLSQFRRVNVAGTARLAKNSAQAGVQRFVYVSSVKVNGEKTAAQQSFAESDAPQPQDPYAVSKLEAEMLFRDRAIYKEMETVVVRPTLVYGSDVGGNMARMMAWVYRGIPLPLAAVTNQRSLVSVDNLCQFLHLCATHPAAANESFLVSDGCPISTPDMLRLLSNAMHKTSRLFSVPEPLLRQTLVLSGLSNLYRRLCESLVVDTKKAEQRLGWQPTISTALGLERMADSYLRAKHLKA